MKNRLLFIMIVLGISLSSFAQAKTKIGVYVVGDALSWEYRTLLGDNLVEKFAESNQYTAVNRSEAVNTLLNEVYKVQSNGHVDFSQIKGTTNQLAESQICGVSIIKIDDKIIFRASLVDVSTAEIIKTASTDCDKNSISYNVIISVSDLLFKRITQGVSSKSYVSPEDVITTSSIELAQKRVEENQKYNVSFAEFKYHTKNGGYYRYLEGNPAALQYESEKEALNITGGLLLPILGGAGALTFGLIYAQKIEESNTIEEKRMNVIIMSSCIAASFLPGIIILSCAPSRERKAWKAYRAPYDNAVTEMNGYSANNRLRCTLQMRPMVSYDCAGIQMRLALY